MANQYQMFKVHVDRDATLERLGQVFDSGFINEGEQVAELNSALQKRLGVERLTLVNAGTSALTLALRIAGVGPGTNVVSTPMTCIASNTPIINLGGDIIWADVDPASGMVTVDTIAAKINAQTKAVMMVDWAGVPAELEALDAECQKQGVKLIQDAAHAFGAEYSGRPIADFADFTCYSFQAIKHFTCGDGGALACRDEADYALAKKLKWFGYDREKAKDEKGNWRGQQAGADIYPEEVGYKFNMNNVSAAIGLTQLQHIDEILERHRANALTYDKIFSAYNTLHPIKRPKGSNPSFWVYTVLLQEGGQARDALLTELSAKGIHAGVVHVPNDDYSAFASCKADLPGVRHFASHQLSLPCGWWLEQSDIEHIGTTLIDLLHN